MSARNPAHGFSLVELVVAVGIISFALISMLGVLTISMTVHQDASTDSVFSVMTESTLQEVRNFNAPAVNLHDTSTIFNFSKLTGYTGYIYFDQDGQITLDQYRSVGGGTATPTTGQTGTTQSLEDGIYNNSGNTGLNVNYSLPLTASVSSGWPATTFYACTITTVQPTLSTGTTTPSMYLIKLTFTWPVGAAVTAAHTRTVISSLSNNTN